MKKKFLYRVAAIGTSALVLAGSVAMLAGCTTSNYPEVTITYSFNGEDYAVHYVLSRVDAPKTVQHFIELADAGFYDGLVVHDYQNYTMKAGGYRLVDGELVETVVVNLPELEFDATATLIDISKLKIVSDNSSMSRLESTAQELREGLIKNIVNRYNWQGFSPENFAIAKQQALKTLKIYVKNRLLEQGVKLGDKAVFRFNWIGEFQQNSDKSQTLNN